MTQNRHDDSLPPMPQRRSPPALDRRILEYAEQQAPVRRRPGQPVWIGGLTAAGIATVAVLLALPANQPPTATLTEEAPSVVPRETSADMKPKNVGAESVARSSASAENTAGFAATDREAKATMQQIGAAGASELQTRAAAPALEIDSAPVNEPAAERGILAAADSARHFGSDLSNDSLSGETDKTMRQAIAACAALIEKFPERKDTQGTENTAEACYQRVRAACTQCELPDTLEEALKTLNDNGDDAGPQLYREN